MTAVFIWVILGVTDARNEFQAFMGPLAIGLALAMIHFASIGATGTSVNPARSIGVGVFGGTDAILQLWLFILAPLARRRDRRPHLPAGLRPRHRAGPRLGALLRRRPPAAGDVRPAERLRAAVEPGPAAAVAARSPGPGSGASRSSRPRRSSGARPRPQQPGQPGQWGQPAPPAAASPPQVPPQGQPQQWGQPLPDDGEDGRTQVRRPD